MADAQIIAVVSGKGGVGKTMLSVAMANELSRSKKTLLLDLDFFNRGLTGLLASLKTTVPCRDIDPPPFLERGGDKKWSLAEVRQNLFMVYFDDLDKSQYDILEMRKIEALAGEIKGYVNYLAQEAGCEFIVLDCHGGPDNTSFAACMMATRAVLVSEPDRITLHGTLNFLRTLRRESTVAPPDIRLVFNKVVSAFTSQFLFRFYDQFLRAEFGGRDLLAIYPIEIYLTKAFEKMPFLTTAYPQSQLAVKTRLTLFELFHDVEPPVLPPQITRMSFLERLQSKYYLGRWPRLLNLDFVLKAIAVYSLFVVGVPLLMDRMALYGLTSADFAKSVSSWATMLLVGIALSAIWVAAVIMLNWAKEIDVFMTYSFRTGAFVRAAIAAITLVALWAFPAVGLGIWIHDIYFNKSNQLAHGMVTAASIATVFFLGLYFRRGIRNIRFDGRYVEGEFRMAFSCAAVALVATYSVIGT